jgi:aerobic-type carbon monoxide dehydrogenase small subunit (CoxS/CutS family)
MMKLTITLNGERKEFDVPVHTTLLSLLRNEAGCFSVKHGCETGECGACAVIMDGRVVNSCILLAAQADEREVITLEGIPWIIGETKSTLPDAEQSAGTAKGLSKSRDLSAEEAVARSSFQNAAAFSVDANRSEYDMLHPIQKAFVDSHAIQCGYCTPGMILSTVALFVEKGLLELPSASPRKKPRRAVKRKAKLPLPDEREIREALAGNLCRCTGYVKPVEAVAQAAEKMRS